MQSEQRMRADLDEMWCKIVGAIHLDADMETATRLVATLLGLNILSIEKEKVEEHLKDMDADKDGKVRDASPLRASLLTSTTSTSTSTTSTSTSATQTFCSALAVGYSHGSLDSWSARLRPEHRPARADLAARVNTPACLSYCHRAA